LDHLQPASRPSTFSVGDRGRLPLEVTDAYRRADQLTAEH
jgi:hypothetical protein